TLRRSPSLQARLAPRLAGKARALLNVMAQRRFPRDLPVRAVPVPLSGTRSAADLRLFSASELATMASQNFSDLWGGRGVFGTNPFREMQRDFNRLFGDAFRRTAPRVDVRESDDEVCVMADVPGVEPSELDVRVDGSTLTLTAQRQDE